MESPGLKRSRFAVWWGRVATGSAVVFYGVIGIGIVIALLASFWKSLVGLVGGQPSPGPTHYAVVSASWGGCEYVSTTDVDGTPVHFPAVLYHRDAEERWPEAGCGGAQRSDPRL